MARRATRREFAIGVGAAALAGYGFRARPAEMKTLRFIAQADLRVLDPLWTTAYIIRNHGYMVFDTPFACDAEFTPHPQMVGEHWVYDHSAGRPAAVLLKARAASSIRVNDISGPMLARNPDRANSRRGCACRFATPKRRLCRDSSSLISPRTAAAVLSIVVTASASRMNHRVECGRRSTNHRIRSLT